jgi:hypothetical protein
MNFANTVVIRRSPHDVFEFLAEFENVPKWNYAIIESHKTSPGPVDVGTTYRQSTVGSFEKRRTLRDHGVRAGSASHDPWRPRALRGHVLLHPRADGSRHAPHE